MRSIILCGLVTIAGCGRSVDTASESRASQAGVADLEVHPNALVEAYQLNPAAADAKYKGKTLVTKMPWQMVREGNETVVRAGVLRYRFVSEAEAAKVEPKAYKVRGKCDGMKDGLIVISGVTIIAPWPD